MKKALALWILGLIVTAQVFAQNRTLSGTVTDAATGEALIGVNVTGKGTASGTVTDIDGKYTLELPKEVTALTFSYIGYTTIEKPITSLVINVAMAADQQIIDEVVVTAVAIEKEKKSIGYSATTVNSDKLNMVKETNLLNALAAKTPGVNITSQSGSIGSGSKITIRGVGSLSGGTPLMVIDGTPVSNLGSTATRNQIIGGGVDQGNKFAEINPDDIESMTILKGGAATALYGSQAANGVIIITTKRGKVSKSKVPSINIGVSVFRENPLKLPTYQNEYAQGNYGIYNERLMNGWGPKISAVQDQNFLYFTGDSVKLKAYNNNVSDFFQNGLSVISNFSISNADEKTDYRFAYSNLTQRGILPESKLGRHTFTINAGRKINEYLESRVSASLVTNTTTGRTRQGSNNESILPSIVLGMPRTINMSDLANNLYDTLGNVLGMDGYRQRQVNNPYWVAQNNPVSDKSFRFFGTGEVIIKPISWYSFTTRVGVDYISENRMAITRKNTLRMLNGAYSTTDIVQSQLNSDLISTFHKKWKNISLTYLTGLNIRNSSRRIVDIAAQDLVADELYTYANAKTVVTTEDKLKTRLIGLYHNLNIGLWDAFYIDGSFRTDFNSTLPKDNRIYHYFGVSGSFLPLSLIKNWNDKWLSYIKLRGSYAQVGSSYAAYLTNFTYNPVSSVYGQFATSITMPYGSLVGFESTGSYPDPNLKPSRQNDWEVGGEFNFFRNRLRVDYTYYQKISKDNIIALPISASTGFTSKIINAGSVSNKGHELLVSATVYESKNKDYAVDLYMNFTKNHQKLEKLYPGLKDYILTSGFSGFQIKAEEGQTFGLYGTAYLRDSSSGKYIINPSNGLRQTAGSPKRFGDIYPDWNMGVGADIYIKGLTLSVLFDFRKGGVMYSGTTSALRTSGLAAETAINREGSFIDDGVLLNGDGTTRPNDVPVASIEDFWKNNYATSLTEANVFDASFIKLRQIAISYALPSKFFENSKSIKGFSIGISGRNLALLKSHVPHVDPETNVFGTSLIGEGYEFLNSPSTRSYGFNINLKF
ncbi:MAG: SusC/RagA family TonB-linked outer membrane protein [Sphingobacteriales bacterium]|jgi:TonB-linked SusC/RagA family outer membrane protein|nr:MAG: SusC/RagA family TonB-linked outer membrane protein [Sphingobacteriales bacterium]